MASPAAVLSVLVKAQGASAAAGQLKAVDSAGARAGSSMDKLASSSAKGHKAMEKTSRAAGFVAVGVGAIGGAAVNAAAKYETSMNTLQAVSSATSSEMNRLSKLAIKLGADVRLPGTSAQDAAEAMTEMIKAGVSMKDTMAGVRSTLVLSAAAQISNAEAAEIASNALNAFKLEGKDVKMVTDQLANTANASSVEIRDVADSFKMAAAVFSGFQAPTLGAKGAMTQLNVAIGLLGNAGIKGSDAGTSLKQTLLQLTGPSDKAKNAMQGLFIAAKGQVQSETQLTGVIKGTTKERGAALKALREANPALKAQGDIAYDAAGKMRPLKDIIALTAAGTKGMTAEQKNAYLTMIFGADATRSVIALMNAGPAAWDKMTASVTKQGAAQAMADAKMKGFKGSLEALKSTLETLAINVGSKLLPALTAIARTLSGVVGALSPTAWLVLISVVGTLAVAVWGIGAAFKVYTAATIALTAAQWLLNTAFLAFPGTWIVAGLVALGVALVVAYKKSETFRNIVNGAWNAVKSATTAAFNAIVGTVKSAWNTISGIFQNIGPKLSGFIRGAIGLVTTAGRALGQGVINGFKAAFDLAKTIVTAVRNVISQAASWGLGVGRKLVDGIKDGIKAAFGGVGSLIGDLAGKIGVGDAGRNIAGSIPGGAMRGGGGGKTGGLAPAARAGLSFINSKFGGVRVSSGFRTPEENARVGGAPNSDHLTGNALDLVPAAGWSAAGVALMDRIAAWAKTSPAVRWIGWRGTPGHGPGDHLHLSFLSAGKQAGDVVAGMRGAIAGGKVRGVGDVADDLGVNEKAKAAGSNLLALAKKVWKAQAPLMGKTARIPPKLEIGETGSAYAWALRDQHLVRLSPDMAKMLRPDVATKDLRRTGALKSLVHEFAHIGQRYVSGKRETEGGAEAFAQRYLYEIMAKAGIPIFGMAGWTYPNEVAWVGKNRGRKWVSHDQFQGPAWSGGAKKALATSRPRAASGGGIGGNVKAVWQFLIGKGFSPAQAAGVIGSMMQESGQGLSTTATNPSSGAFGIAQWLGGRKTALMRRRNPRSLQTQLQHLWAELQGSESRSLKAIRGSKTMNQAATAWTRVFERPAAHEEVLGTRFANARKVFGALKGTKGGGGTATSDGGTATAGPTAYERALAQADLAMAEAQQGGRLKIGSRTVSSSLRQAAAISNKRKVVGAEIRRIRNALKKRKGMTAAKRLDLTQRLTTLLGEHQQLGVQGRELRLPAAAVDAGLGGIDAGAGGDPNQALIDAIQKAADQAAEDARIKAEADAAHTAALKALREEITKANQFATDVRTVQMGQLAKGLADFISGQIGGYGGAGGRALTAGSGTVVRY